jgi:hypothetical protein
VRNRLFGCMLAMAVGMAVFTLMAMPTAGQALYERNAAKQPGAPSWALERAKLPPFNPPRTPEGTPNLQGRWGGPSGGDDIEEHDYVDVSSPPEETYISDPPGGKVPYQPWAKAVQAAHRAGLARGWPGEKERMYPDPQTFCLYSVPRATYRGGFEIVQVPGYVLILYGFNHYYRFIPTDGRPHEGGPNVKLWMGNSRGAWQGNSLVVDVTNLNGLNWLDQVGNFFSNNAHVVERFTLADANTIDYEATIDDAKVFTRPWTIRLPLRRARPAGGDKYADETWENACHEGNEATEHNRALGFKWFRGVTPPR